MPTEQQIMEWAAGGGFDPALGRAFVAQYGRLPSTLDEYTTFRGSQSGGQQGGGNGQTGTMTGQDGRQYQIPVGYGHQQWQDQYGLQRDQYGNIALPQSQAQIRWGDAANQRAGQAQTGYMPNPDVDLGQVYDRVVALWKAGGMPRDQQDPRFPDKNAYIQALQSYGVNPQAAGQMYDAGRQGRTSREDFVQMGTTLGANRTPTLDRQRFDAETAYNTNQLTGRVDGTNTLGRDIGEWTRDQQQRDLQFRQAALQAQLDANPRNWVQAAYNRAGQAGSTTPNAVRDMGAQIAGSPLYQGLTGGQGQAPGARPGGTLQQQEFASAQAQRGNRMLNANPDLPAMTAGNRTNYRAWQRANPTQRALTEGLVSGQAQDPGDWKDEMQRGLPTPGNASFTTRRRTKF